MTQEKHLEIAIDEYRSTSSVGLTSSVTDAVEVVASTQSGITVLTYGTFDLIHVGHLNLLERLRALGDRLIVGVSTDEFNASKGKKTVIPFDDRKRMVAGLRCVDEVIAEHSWTQKPNDIKRYNIDIFGMGADWEGKFDNLRKLCKVLYLPRTVGISSTALKSSLAKLSPKRIGELEEALELLSAVVESLK